MRPRSCRPWLVAASLIFLSAGCEEPDCEAERKARDRHAEEKPPAPPSPGFLVQVARLRRLDLRGRPTF